MKSNDSFLGRHLKPLALAMALASPQLMLAQVDINEENFPDEAFRNYVTSYWDSDSDGKLSSSEIKGVQGSIYLSDGDYESLKGIEHFTNITELQVSSNSNLTSLDVSALSKLTVLNADNSPLESLVLPEAKGKLVTLNLSQNCLTSLDVSGYTKLQSLHCTSAYGDLETINASGCTALTDFDYSTNGLKSLNLEGTKLEGLSIRNAADLTELNVKNCARMTSLTVYKAEMLKELDVTGCAKLKELEATENESLATINLGGNTVVTTLDLHKNALTSFNAAGLVSLTKLDVSENEELATLENLTELTKLESLYCYNTAIETLDISGLTKLKSVYAYKCENLTTINAAGCTALTDFSRLESSSDPQDFPALTTINAAGCTALTGFTTYGTPVIESIDLSNCTGLTGVGISGKETLKELKLEGVSELTSLSVYENSNLESLNLKGMTKLEKLNAYSNNLKSLDLTDNTALKYINVNDNKELAAIDVKALENLENLYVSNTAIKTLDVSGLTKLYTVDCQGISEFIGNECDNLNSVSWTDELITKVERKGCKMTGRQFYGSSYKLLESIDFSGSTNLEGVYIQGLENLTSVNLSGATALKDVTIQSNPKLASVDLSDAAAMKTVYINENALTKLDLTASSKITSITANKNQLTELLFNSPVLTDLYANDNQLTSLDVTNSSGLTTLNVENNQLTALDLSKNKKLQDLNVANNQLTSLDVTACPELYYLNVENNQLTSLDLNQQESFNSFSSKQNRVVDLATLSATQVGFQVDDAFNSDNVTSLQVDFSDIEPTFVTISGKRYFVVYNNAKDAEELKSKPITYYYRTREDGQYSLEIALTVNDIVKGPQALVIDGAASVKGTYGSEVTAPKVNVPDGYDGTVSYKSGDEKVVTVDTEGKLTVVGAGKTQITVSGTESTYGAAPDDVTYDVEIEKASVELAFAEKALEVVIGDAVPANALTKGIYDGTVTYASSDEKVATVDEDGQVTIVAAGEATITASGAATDNCNEAKAASYTLTVKKHAASLTLAAESVKATYGETAEAPAVTAVEGYDGTVSYASSDEKVVKVAADGTLEIVGAGEAKITVSGSETDSYFAPAEVVYTVEVAKASPVFTFENETVSATVGESVGNNALTTGVYDGEVEYTSSDESIAEVDQKTGDVTVKAAGTVTITATGKGTANCEAASASYELNVSYTTGINGVRVDANDGNYYTLKGVRVDVLKKGQVYIHNGKKVVFK